MVAITIETYLGDVGVIDISSDMVIQDIKLLIEEIFNIDMIDQVLYTTYNNNRNNRILIDFDSYLHNNIDNIFVDLDSPGLLTEEEHENLFSGNINFIKHNSN
jgi:hypothetical protein